MDEHIQSHNSAEVGQAATINYEGDNRSSVQIAPDVPGDNTITWEASEYVNHEKDPTWFASIGLLGIAIAAILYFVVDLVSAIVAVALTVALIVYSQVKPQTQRYTMSSVGISVGDKDYHYDMFKSFSVSVEGGIGSIHFMPLNRFMIPLVIYVAPENQEAVLNLVSAYLPNEQREPDLFDKLTARLRF